MSLLPNLDQMTDNEKLAVLESIQKSIAESKEIQKKKIGENVDLVVQALKKIESDIRDRFDAVGNSIEKRVLSIQDGRDGADGKDGRDGKDGKSGRDGLKGDRGVDGQAGRDGVDGVDGISVVNAQIDFDGSLVITLSDGRELNVGEVVSQDIAEKIKVISTMSTNGAVGIKDEGSSISTGVKTINFVGAAVTATNSGDDVTVNVSSGTGTVTSVAATGGTGISVSGSPITTTGTLTITNTAPDQTVALTAGTGISTSGTYPSFTITNSAPDQTVALTAGTGISTSGTYPNFTVTNSAPDQTVALTQAGTTTITGTYPNFTISSADQFSGTVTSVAATVPAFLSITGSPVTTTGTLAIGLSGTALPVLNGGTGITAFGTGVATALGVNTGSSGAFVVNGGALGTPSSGTVTNLTGTASININGTVGATTASSGAFTTLSATGVTTVQAGTAALPAITTTGDTNTGIFFPAADTLGVSTGGSERVRVDSNGNVGIGTSSPSYRLEVKGPSATAGQLSIHDGTGDTVTSGNNAASLLFQARDSSVRTIAEIDGVHTTTNGTGGAMVFQTRVSDTLAERMRIDSSGNLLVGLTSGAGERLSVVASSGNAAMSVQVSANGNAGVNFKNVSTTTVGQIVVNAATTAYNTSSDYRLKNTIAPMTGALTKVQALKPVTYKWNIDGEAGEGFIAHELAEVCPHAVTGEKDAVDADGNPVYQGIDTSFLVATLTAAIQEQQALITALTARITALENK